MKKIMRKGFTLVELLVVLTVIGILTSIATISGSEVSNIAQANKIIENFRIISAAMNMYYSDNTDECNKDSMNATTIKTALEAYLKSTTYIDAAGSAPEGKFNISISTTDKAWWLTYTLPATSVQIAKILANKALQEGLVSGVGKIAGTEDGRYKVTVAESGNLANCVSVCYKVR